MSFFSSCSTEITSLKSWISFLSVQGNQKELLSGGIRIRDTIPEEGLILNVEGKFRNYTANARLQ
jgi:hypothetical protein